MYELFYSTGGHGGPCPTEFEAKLRALRMLSGNCNERWIAVRNRETGEEVARITRLNLNQVNLMGRKSQDLLIGV